MTMPICLPVVCPDVDKFKLDKFLKVFLKVRNPHVRECYLVDLVARWEAEYNKFNGNVDNFMQSLKGLA